MQKKIGLEILSVLHLDLESRFISIKLKPQKDFQTRHINILDLDQYSQSALSKFKNTALCLKKQSLLFN